MLCALLTALIGMHTKSVVLSAGLSYRRDA